MAAFAKSWPRGFFVCIGHRGAGGEALGRAELPGAIASST